MTLPRKSTVGVTEEYSENSENEGNGNSLPDVMGGSTGGDAGKFPPPKWPVDRQNKVNCS